VTEESARRPERNPSGTVRNRGVGRKFSRRSLLGRGEVALKVFVAGLPVPRPAGRIPKAARHREGEARCGL